MAKVSRLQQLVAAFFALIAVMSFVVFQLLQVETREQRERLLKQIPPTRVIHRLVDNEIDVESLSGGYKISALSERDRLRWEGTARLRHENGEYTRIPLEIEWHGGNGRVTLAAYSYGQSPSPLWHGFMPEGQMGNDIAREIQHLYVEQLVAALASLTAVLASLGILFHRRMMEALRT